MLAEIACALIAQSGAPTVLDDTWSPNHHYAIGWTAKTGSATPPKDFRDLTAAEMETEKDFVVDASGNALFQLKDFTQENPGDIDSVSAVYNTGETQMLAHREGRHLTSSLIWASLPEGKQVNLLPFVTKIAENYLRHHLPKHHKFDEYFLGVQPSFKGGHMVLDCDEYIYKARVPSNVGCDVTVAIGPDGQPKSLGVKKSKD